MCFPLTALPLTKQSHSENKIIFKKIKQTTKQCRSGKWWSTTCSQPGKQVNGNETNQNDVRSHWNKKYSYTFSSGSGSCCWLFNTNLNKAFVITFLQLIKCKYSTRHERGSSSTEDIWKYSVNNNINYNINCKQGNIVWITNTVANQCHKNKLKLGTASKVSLARKAVEEFPKREKSDLVCLVHFSQWRTWVAHELWHTHVSGGDRWQRQQPGCCLLHGAQISSLESLDQDRVCWIIKKSQAIVTIHARLDQRLHIARLS